MNGSPSIAVDAGRWNKAAIERFFATVAVGIFAGVLVAFVHQPLHLPGHKVIWWMPALIATRLRTGLRGGATLGTVATIGSTALLGGRMPGGDIYLPMAIASGLLLDFCIDRLRFAHLNLLGQLLCLSAAGLLGNLLCMLTRASGQTGYLLFGLHISISANVLISFAGFGLVAGVIGCLLGGPKSRDQSGIEG